MNKVLLTLIFILPLSLHAQDETWKLAITEPRCLGDAEGIANSFLSQFYSNLQRYDSHKLNQSEKEAYLELIASKEKSLLYSELNELIEKRDALLFLENNWEEYIKYSHQIEDKKDALANWHWDETPEIPEEMPLEILSYSEESSFYPLTGEGIPEDCRWVIQSRFTVMQDQIQVELFKVQYTDGSQDAFFSTSGSPDNLELWILEAEQQLLDQLLGRPWASVRMIVEPPDAAIFSGDELLGIGEVFLRGASPGTMELHIRRDGYHSQSRNLVLEEGVNPSFSMVLEKAQGPLYWVRSNPEGADVYLGSRWMGTTPLELELPGENLSILVKKEDYQQEYLASADVFEDIVVDLYPLKVDMQELLAIKKKKFYNSLAAFTLSLAFPIVMNGVESNRASYYGRMKSIYYGDPTAENLDRLDKAEEQYMNSYYTYGASMGISGALLGFNLYRLFDYIRTAERAILEE